MIPLKTSDDELLMQINATLAQWHASNNVQRLWSRDATLWTGADEASWLGWLEIVKEQLEQDEHLRAIADEIRQAGFSHALLLGMGGSSLCPEVLKTTFGTIDGFPELFVLDSTDPAQINTFERKVDLAHTLFIISSKSGTTLEPNILKQYFFERVKQVVGAQRVGQQFLAITDPGSALHRVAEADGFRHILFGVPSIGGRFSALSNFGMAPAAIMGINTQQLLRRAEMMVRACSPDRPAPENPGVVLGAILGVLANHGRNKVTIIASPAIRSLGAWLEQLLAESTGKAGRGLIPVDGEPIGQADVYGDDRLFIYVRLEAAPDATQDAAIDLLEAAGQPVVRLSMTEPMEIGQEFFRWEMATAVAGSIMGIHPFNQPDVEASKVETRNLTAAYEQAGSLPPETPILQEDGIKLFADEANAAALAQAAGHEQSLVGYLRAHLRRIGAGDYFALLAYIEMNEAHEHELQKMRRLVRDATRAATCLGFGPRFLHSTGQVYKGGPNTGVFLQITADDAVDLPVPGQAYTFGVVKAAQARGDFQVLAQRGRRLLRVHLSADTEAGLAMLREATAAATR
ncbi:MAG: bifunctional transaldolase/phosoglucose isomerase [Acidobacteriota bacterium]|nr:bifunctional transaldolase/phosoglucose isomerase [Blastocatellia bacterium]MDW8240993.1 bifunctional transaldolase/phosoglucose isomerase [Acidobacteriota bacterium]